MNPSIKNHIDSYRRISGITVMAVYFLILVGGIVRSTGSGMGCPDWPMCFGSVVPPTSISQLPDNYQEIYLEKRLAKNKRFVAMLEKFGFKETAFQIANDKSILIEEEFNATKTWIEYINRLIGVLIGFLILRTCWKSLKLRKVDRLVPIYSFIALIVVLFTGWIGSIVVSTNLLPWIITFHMLLAIALVIVLMLGHHRADKLVQKSVVSFSIIPSKVFWLLVLGFLLILIQVILGTQVREQIDQVSFSLGNLLREEWIGRSGVKFLIHRSFSLAVLTVQVMYLYWAFKYSSRKSSIGKWSFIMMAILLLEIGTGIGMAYFGIPAFLQPIHLVLGCLLIGVQFLLLLKIRDNSQHVLNSNVL